VRVNTEDRYLALMRVRIHGERIHPRKARPFPKVCYVVDLKNFRLADTCVQGLTEKAQPENDGPSKSRGVNILCNIIAETGMSLYYLLHCVK